MSLAVLPVHIGLVDETRLFDRADLQEIAGALNEQLSSHVGPEWGNKATVGIYDAASPGMWKVAIQKQLDEPGALGYHTDEDGQPVAYVMATGRNDTPRTISHEVVEMVVDPFGSRMHGARIPFGIDDYRQFGLHHPHSHMSYLLEACDPPEAYPAEIGGVPVSDFLLKGWYYPTHLHSPRTYFGGCTEALEVADGGYVSFSNPATREWYQVFNESGDLQVSALGQFDKAEFYSLREFTDAAARAYRRR